MWNRVFLSGLLILLSLVYTNAIPSHSPRHRSQYHSAVLDTEGNELEAGMPYYMVSAARGGGGGGVSVGRREQSTPQGQTTNSPTVQQSAYDLNLGTPVIFSPASSQHPELLRFLGETEAGEELIQESMDMNIRFSGTNDRVWQVEQGREESSEQRDSTRFVTLGGKPGYPGSSTVRNWFQIERINQRSRVYRIIYCPNVSGSSEVNCGTVGITQKNGNRWLSVSEQSGFPFVFIRAQPN